MTNTIDIDRDMSCILAPIRSNFYGIATLIVNTLPDQQFLTYLKGSSFGQFLDDCLALNNKKINPGIFAIQSYIEKIEIEDERAILKDLAIDRTQLFRAHANDVLIAPYEGLYRDQDDASLGSSIVNVKSFYRRAGVIPDDNNHESADYLGVQLDFMRLLCLREEKQWHLGENTGSILSLERKFLQEHLNPWIGKYCNQAIKVTKTKFYKGFLKLLNEMIKVEYLYLDCNRR